jgi:hypothetical protein
MADRIVEIVSADPGWRAVFGAPSAGEESTHSRIVAWALVETQEGDRSVVGLIVDPNDPSGLVPAPTAVSPVAGEFARYGFSAG